jgi:predicted TIM-barrel fold metal-dependent hydrolase
MDLNDLVLVSIDDHVIEPPDLFQRHMPERLRSQAPYVEHRPDGSDRWLFQGTECGPTGLGAVATWPREEWSMDPIGFAEMRPAAYDIHDRVRDMNINGVAASMCFPTFPGFAGTWLAQAPDRPLTNMAISAYNDWHIDEWCASYPGRFLPLAVGPLWDRDALVAEIHRVAAKGCTAISLPETPYGVGLPSFYTDHWDPVFTALCDTDVTVCMHIGGAFGLLRRPEGAPHDQLIIMSPQLSAVATTDLMVSGTFNRFPDLRVAMSEGGIGWIPFLLDRLDRHIWNHSWTGLDFGGLTGTELFRKNFLGCFITDPSALQLADRIGTDTIAWECDYPHSDSTWPTSPESLSAELTAAGLSDDVIEKITWRNASRFFRHDPFCQLPREQLTVGALRRLNPQVDTTTTSRHEYRARYEARVSDAASPG